MGVWNVLFIEVFSSLKKKLTNNPSICHHPNGR